MSSYPDVLSSARMAGSIRTADCAVPTLQEALKNLLGEVDGLTARVNQLADRLVGSTTELSGGKSEPVPPIGGLLDHLHRDAATMKSWIQRAHSSLSRIESAL